jgi:hypothetical protein
VTQPAGVIFGQVLTIAVDIKRGGVARRYRTEVSAVERGDPDGLEALGKRHQAGVRSTQREVAVLLDQVLDPLPVVVCQRFHQKCAVDDRVIQRDLGGNAQVPFQQIRRFSDDHRGGDQRSIILLQQIGALPVPRVSAIGRRDQDTGVDDERPVSRDRSHRRGALRCDR